MTSPLLLPPTRPPPFLPPRPTPRARSLPGTAQSAGMADLRLVEQAGQGQVDVTVGRALDLFGGTGVTYRELVAWNRRNL